MGVELLQTFSLVAYILAAVFFVVAILLFFLLEVPKLIGDLSGKTAKKAIEEIRKQNERTGDKVYKPSAVNAARGALTDKISPSGHLQKRDTSLGAAGQTEKIATEQLQSEETTILCSEAEATTVLSRLTEETTVLNPNAEETTVLSQTVEVEQVDQKDVVFTLESEIDFTSTSEIIE